MAYELIKLTDLQATPSADAERFGRLGTGVVLFATGKKFKGAGAANEWFNVLIPPGIRDGWIPAANCKEVPDPERPGVDPEMFVRQCILVERTFNDAPSTAPWFVSADFLIARALIETNMTNPGPDAGSDGVGPLRVSSKEWDSYLQNGGTQDGYGPADRNFPMVQVRGAAYRMHADAKAISAARPTNPAVAGSDDPFLPSYLDLFHAYLTDPKTALAIRDAENDANKKVGDILTQDQVTAIGARRQFSEIKSSMTVVDFGKKTEEVLNAALKEAFDKVKQFAPEELPQAKPGKATWMDFAIAEKNAGVTEKTQPDRIKSYFADTDFGPVGASIPHWCGAFVAHCIKESGNGSSIPKGAALAANWKAWGQRLPVGTMDVPVGAVVVLTPSPGTNTSGHVGFFAGFQAVTKKVTLLGGNQNDGVNETPYDLSRVAAIQWLETAPVGTGAATGKFNLKAAGVKQDFWQFGDMIVDRFSRAGFGPIQQLAALANAIGESGLDPKAKSPGTERSFGLFQCNQTAGLGIGFTVEQLTNPEINIGIIIKETKKFAEFAKAATIDAAVDAFVRFIERPKDTTGAIKRRLEIAGQLSKA